jgi:predicted PurR-regulated permease PerM
MNHKFTLQTTFLFALFALLFTLVVCILFPFFNVILWAALLYIALSPLHKKFLKKISPAKKSFELKRHLLAASFSIGTLLLIIGPLSFLVFQIIHQLLTTLKDIEVFIAGNPSFLSDFLALQSVSKFLTTLGLDGITLLNLDTLNIRATILTYVQQYSNNLFSWSTNIIGGAGSFLISLVFLIFILYFFYLDSGYLFSLFAKAVPINPSYMKTLTAKFSETIKGLLSGYVLVALYQGAAAFILMKIFGVKAALLFSVVLMFASFIPLFGSAIVWAPIGIIMIFTGPAWKGILFLLLSGFCISFLDNFLRPFFLKEKINVHPLVIFFAILGGIQVFGVNGLILGPLVVILFFSVLDMIITNDSKKNIQSETD